MNSTHTAPTSTDVTVIPNLPAPQTPVIDHSTAEGCGTLIGTLLSLGLIGWAVCICIFSEVPLGYRFAFGRERLDGSRFTFQIEDRIFFHDKYALVNNSPHDLKGVHLTFITTFVGGEKSTAYRYWHEWPADSGRRLDAATTGDSLQFIEAVSVYAYSDKYFFSRSFGATE